MTDDAPMTDVLEPPTGVHEPDSAAPTPSPEIPMLARVLGATGRALILAGVIVLMFVSFQLWGTDLQEARAQDGLAADLDDRFEAVAATSDPSLFARPADAPADSDTDADDGATGEGAEGAEGAGLDDDPVVEAPTTTVTRVVDDSLLDLLFPDDGDALAKIEIPTIDVDKVVVRGVAVADLRKGPGHYSQTSLPGNPGNSSIAGHRTTYGAPFNRIDELVPGDEITVTTVQGDFVYRVLDPTIAYADDLDRVLEVGAGHIIVDPSATWVLGDFGDDRLTLTACHPKLSSRQRIIVSAKLVDEPVELPQWAIIANAEREAELRLAAADSAERATTTTAPLLADTTDADPDAAPDPVAGVASPPAQTPDLDEGLNGERDAIVPAAVWMAAALACWYIAGRLGRRFGAGRLQRVAIRFAGVLPAAVCLWSSFELIDRALPAG